VGVQPSPEAKGLSWQNGDGGDGLDHEAPTAHADVDQLAFAPHRVDPGCAAGNLIAGPVCEPENRAVLQCVHGIDNTVTGLLWPRQFTTALPPIIAGRPLADAASSVPSLP
jgi:hypothetical protein